MVQSVKSRFHAVQISDGISMPHGIDMYTVVLCKIGRQIMSTRGQWTHDCDQTQQICVRCTAG